MEPELSIVTWHDVTHDVIKARHRKTPAPIHSGPHRIAPGKTLQEEAAVSPVAPTLWEPMLHIEGLSASAPRGPLRSVQGGRRMWLVSRSFHTMWVKFQKRDSSSRTGHLWTSMEESTSGNRPPKRDNLRQFSSSLPWLGRTMPGCSTLGWSTLWAAVWVSDQGPAGT